MKNNVEIISVNYNTPDLIERLIKSVREVEGDYPIRIIDGSDKPHFIDEIKRITSTYTNVTLNHFDYNIHHGRGMNHGLLTSNYEWVMIMDSDNYFKQPTIDKMVEACETQGKYMCGWSCNVNANGIDVPRENPQIKYYHPSMLLIQHDFYKELKECCGKSVGFIHHGAPCIQIMKYLHDNKLSDVVGIDLYDLLQIDFKNNEERNKWTCLESRGTVNRFGYQF